MVVLREHARAPVRLLLPNAEKDERLIVNVSTPSASKGTRGTRATSPALVLTGDSPAHGYISIALP